jgi:hypothetical protein
MGQLYGTHDESPGYSGAKNLLGYFSSRTTAADWALARGLLSDKTFGPYGLMQRLGAAGFFFAKAALQGTGSP